jgi:hypothetical protein
MWYLVLLLLSVAQARYWECDDLHIMDYKHYFETSVVLGELSDEKISFFQDTGHDSESNTVLIECLEQDGWYLTIENVSVREVSPLCWYEIPEVLCYPFRSIDKWYYGDNITNPSRLCITADDIRKDLVPLLVEPDSRRCLGRGRGWISVISFNPLLSNNTARILSARKEWEEFLLSDNYKWLTSFKIDIQEM